MEQGDDTESVGGEPIHVLLVEDNEGFAYFVKDVLLRQLAGRFTLQVASMLEAGLSLLRAGGIDIVLLDLGLPDSHGYETFSRARAEAPHTPFIVLTALDDETMAIRAMRDGAQDYLVKDTFDKALLNKAIRYAIERAKAEGSLRHLSGRLLKLQDEERQRIARELHDVTAQKLAALSMNLGALKASRCAEEHPRLAALVEDSLALSDECATELRTLSYLLHAPLLDELGLAGAVRDFADGFSRRCGIRVDLEIDPSIGTLSREMETTLLRVLQEALNNVLRHSGSRTASIRLLRDASSVVLEVEDSGRGLSGGDVSDTGLRGIGLGVGILGMRERLRQLGGRLEIRSGAVGTLVRGILPLGRQGGGHHAENTSRGRS